MNIPVFSDFANRLTKMLTTFAQRARLKAQLAFVSPDIWRPGSKLENVFWVSLIINSHSMSPGHLPFISIFSVAPSKRPSIAKDWPAKCLRTTLKLQQMLNDVENQRNPTIRRSVSREAMDFPHLPRFTGSLNRVTGTPEGGTYQLLQTFVLCQGRKVG